MQSCKDRQPVPIIIPPFSQYQAPLFPLRGLWNTPPAEGDMFVNAEVDWGTYPPGQAVQFALSGNSPVAFSQIVALSVDNSRCGADVQFIFADSGFVLLVPAHAGGTFPVYTNGLNFFVAAIGAGASDVTVLNVHNSMPPPIQMALSERQNSVSFTGIAPTNGTTVIVPAPTSGTLNGASIMVDYIESATETGLQLALTDGTGKSLWQTTFHAPLNTQGVQSFELTGMSVRFVNGLYLAIINSTLTGNDVIVNAYYTVP